MSFSEGHIGKPGISVNTIKAHVRNVDPKLRVKSRYKLVFLLKPPPEDPDSPAQP
jgi:hypothetical protein